jgi:hypothetical protein
LRETMTGRIPACGKTTILRRQIESGGWKSTPNEKSQRRRSLPGSRQFGPQVPLLLRVFAGRPPAPPPSAAFRPPG